MYACSTESRGKDPAIHRDVWDIWAMALLLLEEGGKKITDIEAMQSLLLLPTCLLFFKTKESINQAINTVSFAIFLDRTYI